jgi:hypothetical protein
MQYMLRVSAFYDHRYAYLITKYFEEGIVATVNVQ